MSTTTLFVELLIIGLEVCIWLILLVTLRLGNSCWLFDIGSRFRGYAALATIAVVGIAYLLGIVMDKVAHFLIGYERLIAFFQPRPFEKLKGLLEAYDVEKNKEHPRMLHAQIMARTGELGGDVLYARSKIRILRASVLNVPLIVINATLLLRRAGSDWLLALILGMIFSGIIIFAYLYTQRLYNLRLRRFKIFLGEIRGPTESK